MDRNCSGSSFAHWARVSKIKWFRKDECSFCGRDLSYMRPMDVFRGTCSIHGKFAVCNGLRAPDHVQLSFVMRSHPVPDDQPGYVEYAYLCPRCYRQYAQEAERRNNEEVRRVRETVARYAAEYGTQGFTQPAAEAMARKRFREKDGPQREWRGADIFAEQQRAELQPRIEAGDLVRCPRCEAYAPASQGVVLAHSRSSGPASVALVNGEGERCKGEGEVVRST
jgi:hypothetical protein